MVVVGPQILLGDEVQHETPFHHHERPDETNDNAGLNWHNISFVIDLQEQVKECQSTSGDEPYNAKVSNVL